MRFSQAFIPTRKENPADAEMPSHRLLIRAGFIEQVAAGIYNLLPLGWRTARRISEIVRQEMDRAGAQEMLMPMVQPAELWERSGRWQKYGPDLLRLTDRKGQHYCLGPTHEEVITDLVSRHVRSYRDMPLNLYQIQVKFRDEVRPRAGLLRGREFMMKDAYSFDAGLDAAIVTYDKMRDAYTRIFTRCGLDFQPVEADSGNIGGSHSHEFQVLAKTGEDRIVNCSECDYTANEERAELAQGAATTISETTPDAEEIATPGRRTIDEVSSFLKRSPAQMIKTLIFLADGKPIVALVRGDHTLNEIKLKAVLGADELFLATDATITEVTGAPVGFAGPVGLDVEVIVDYDVAALHDAATGANKKDAHLIHVEPGRDFPLTRVADLRMAQCGDPCPRCQSPLSDFRGIEVGHIFILGTKYSEPMGATYLDTDGKDQPIVMGCYGIGVTRIMAAAVEQNHDEHGIIWPLALAPFQVQVLPLQMQIKEVVEAAEQLYEALRNIGVDVLLDDRDLRAGGKFKDADLVGTPLRIVIGSRGLKQGAIELKNRITGDVESLAPDAIVAHIQSLLATN